MRVAVLLVPGAGTIPRGSAAVVIDVLRASTTLTVGLTNRARGVVPVATPEEAFERKRRDPEALLCGERDGRKIPGFDLGNSPREYPAEVVSDRTLIFASTNGSLAMIRARSARRRLLGCFLNASAVVESLAGEDRVALVCAGKLGRFSLEDAACAGWLTERLVQRGARIEDASARFARGLAPRDRFEVRALIEGSSHGRYLRGLGTEFRRDVALSAMLDHLSRVFEI